MRLSSDRLSPDWHPISLYATVTLDGVAQSECLFADEDSGEIQRFAVEGGKYVIDAGFLRTESVRGEVKIEVAEQHRHLLEKFPFGPARDWLPEAP
jgi:hypothetical protein